MDGSFFSARPRRGPIEASALEVRIRDDPLLPRDLAIVICIDLLEQVLVLPYGATIACLLQQHHQLVEVQLRRGSTHVSCRITDRHCVGIGLPFRCG
eukprot:SAG11_NODE_13368_length_658_cov_1.105546_1_plen_96_part_10